MNKLLQNISRLETELDKISLDSETKILDYEQNFRQFCYDLFSEASKELLQITDRKIAVPPIVKIGHITKAIHQDFEPIKIPALVPFAQSKAICFEVDEENREEIHELMQFMALNIIQQLPINLCQCYFVDLKGIGLSFPFANSLNEKVKGKEDVITDDITLRNFVNQLTENNKTVITKFLTYRFKTLQDYNQSADIKEAFKFIFVANFPKDFTKDAINKLSKLVENGNKTGFYFIRLFGD
jgi:hypothetical protein